MMDVFGIWLLIIGVGIGFICLLGGLDMYLTHCRDSLKLENKNLKLKYKILREQRLAKEKQDVET